MEVLRLDLLGGFQARTPTGGVVALPARKSQALLAFLAVSPGQAHARNKLATLLWGDMRQRQARGNLRQALAGPGVISATLKASSGKAGSDISPSGRAGTKPKRG